MQTGEIVMGICRIGASFISSFVFEEPSPFFSGQKLQRLQWGICICFLQAQTPTCAKEGRRNFYGYTGLSKKVAHFSSTSIYIRVMPYKLQNVRYLY